MAVVPDEFTVIGDVCSVAACNNKNGIFANISLVSIRFFWGNG